MCFGFIIPPHIHASEGNVIFSPIRAQCKLETDSKCPATKFFKNMTGPLEAGSRTGILPRAKEKYNHQRKNVLTPGLVFFHCQIYGPAREVGGCLAPVNINF